MRILLATLTALMLFAIPVLAGTLADANTAYKAKDYENAFRLYKSFAEQGLARAQANLGLMYDNGEGILEDDAKAAYWYHKAAEQGHAKSQYNLGQCYYYGCSDMPKDYGFNAKAAHWWRKAAEQGHARAQYNLAIMYDNGSGIPEDNAKAAYWYRKAAEQGHVSAQYSLGLMYYKEEGVPEDNVKAYAWWNIAAARRHKGAMKNKDIIMELMSPAQITEAQKLSSELWEKYLTPFPKD